MHCGGCVRRVTAALQGVSGVQVSSVEVGRAKMQFPSGGVTAEEVAGAVNKIGFTAHIE
jgi:copper chaperone